MAQHEEVERNAQVDSEGNIDISELRNMSEKDTFFITDISEISTSGGTL